MHCKTEIRALLLTRTEAREAADGRAYNVMALSAPLYAPGTVRAPLAEVMAQAAAKALAAAPHVAFRDPPVDTTAARVQPALATSSHNIAPALHAILAMQEGAF